MIEGIDCNIVHQTPTTTDIKLSEKVGEQPLLIEWTDTDYGAGIMPGIDTGCGCGPIE